MWLIDDILRKDKFNDLSNNQLLEIINILRNDLKYYKYRKDTNQDQNNTHIQSLKAQLQAEKREVERLKQVNVNYRNKITGNLTIWERIKGRIDLKN